jgi:L-rhamnose mutarotase
MAMYAFTVPILPGKTETWLKYMQELRSSRWDEMVEAIKSAGVRSLQARLERTPMGDFSVVWFDGDSPTKFFNTLFESNEPTVVWFREKVLIECEGAKPGLKWPDQNELVLDFSGQGQTTKTKAYQEAHKK